MLYARLGDVAAAQRTLRKLDSLRSSFPTAFNQSCYYNLAGEIALAEGHPENAVQQFTAAFAAYPRAVSHAGLGMAFERLQNWDRAEEAWKRVLDAKGEILLHLFPLDWEIAHLELARLKKQLNQDQAAQSYYEQFLHLWRDADNLPLREQAQREYKELTEKVSAGKN
jgi:tetratricopeptide (TPR) repeat protein